MVGFREDYAKWEGELASLYLQMRKIEYDLNVLKQRQTQLGHKKPTEKAWQEFRRMADGRLSFKCMNCGKRDIADSRAARFCKDCKAYSRTSRFEMLGWKGYGGK